jgi:hypothetical protein
MRAQRLVLALGRSLGLNAAYQAFGQAAELEDRHEALRAAGWHVLGRAIIVALSSRANACAENQHRRALGENGADPTLLESKDIFADAPAVREQIRDVANNLSLLIDAGRKGGSISAAAVHDIAQRLDSEIAAMLRLLDEVVVKLSAAATRPK